jgi:hypothetical protein
MPSARYTHAEAYAADALAFRPARRSIAATRAFSSRSISCGAPIELVRHLEQMRHDPVEASEQSVDLALPTVQLLRDQQPVRNVAIAEREGFDAAMRLPLRQAVTEIGLDTSGGLVALLGSLGEKLHNERGERRGEVAIRSLGGTGCRAIWQCTHSIGSAAVKGSCPVNIS